MKRHQASLKKLKTQIDAPKIAAAKASFQVKWKITDPTLINPTTTPRKRAKSISNKLNKATGANNNPIKVDDDTPTKQGKYWEQSKQMEATPPPPIVQYRHVLQSGTLLGNETLIMALKKLKTNHNNQRNGPILLLIITSQKMETQ